jgi:hypothetical protein
MYPFSYKFSVHWQVEQEFELSEVIALRAYENPEF